MRELIVYATPTGPLARSCDAFFAAARAVGATAAQAYPPHCTLTGFFRRPGTRIPEVQREIDAAVALARTRVAPTVEVVGVVDRDGWLGLELRSRYLHAVTASFVDAHEALQGEEPLRPKDWLHLSLAYGVADLEPYAALAAGRRFDHEVRWDVALWERCADGSWRVHADSR